jgi:hypothetical protein
MAHIFNETEILFSPQQQQTLRNAATNITVKFANFRDNAENLFDVYDENDNYIFSYDSEADMIY